MTNRPAVVVCADDFGITEATSATICELLATGAVNATTCLVDGPGWRAGAERLRELADQRPAVAVGLHLELPSSWVSSTVALAAFDQQWRAFEASFGRAPDFVDGHRHVHLFPGPRRALFDLLARTGARPWLRQCRTSSRRPQIKRLALDPLGTRFGRDARRRGYAVNPGFGGVRRFSSSEDMAAIWRRDVGAMTRGGVLMTHPGAVDPHEPISACRAQEAELLANGAVAAALAQHRLVMAETRAPWGS